MTRKPPSAAKMAKQMARQEKEKMQWIEYEKQMKEKGKDIHVVVQDQRRIMGDDDDQGD